MNATDEDDGTLLRRFAGEADEAAFRELVRRHLAMVRGVAARQLGGDAHLADEVAQDVFTLLARRAGRLSGHPSVAGWLFTAARNSAANLRRARARRSRHEQEANMAEANQGDEAAALWSEVRPLLDEGLARLGEGEREVLLLRFGEGAGYAEIAARCGLKENAARMRAERALEKLRAWLARRGVTSTAAALGAAVAAHAAPVVSAGAVAQVAAGALAGAAAMGSAGGATTALAATVDFMSKAKVLGTLVVIAAGVAVYEAREARVAARETAAWRRQAEAAKTREEAMRKEVAEANRRAQAADEDNARLATVIAGSASQTRRAEGAGGTEAATSRAEATRRFERAKALVAEQHYEEALKEYLWCFEVGMRGMAFFDYRYREIPEGLAKLTENYPAAAEVLRERRTEFLRRALSDERDFDSVLDFASMSKALRDPAALVDAINRFPVGDSRRETMLNQGAYETLLEARNYAALVREKPADKMMESLNFLINAPLGTNAEKSRAKFQTEVLKSAARDFEVLLGAGDEASARKLAEKILAREDSAEMRAVLAEKAKRAGRSEWKLPGS